MLETAVQRARSVAPAVEFWSLRLVEEAQEHLAVRRDVPQPCWEAHDCGAMVTVVDRGGIGYGATSELTSAGLAAAFRAAREWAHRAGEWAALVAAEVPRDVPQGTYRSPVRVPWASVALRDKLALLARLSAELGGEPTVVDWEAELWHSEVETWLITGDGGDVRQQFAYVLPALRATANAGGDTQTRTFGGHAKARQGGWEVLEAVGFTAAAPQVAAEARALLAAPDCPTERCDVLLAPDQMVLQIHESIGHPLELDRILGDERNYAGSTFVTLDMFGHYQYGSSLLDVTFDPTRPEQLASYGFDDEGTPAERVYVIREGVLLRPLGGRSSQARAGCAGTANARATSWNRPPVDRMANLNVEPGSFTATDLVRSIERGVYMETNCSWSIDDHRNKFQFGCELGRLIVDGELGGLVRNPNYRGRSATFWRSLAAVGDADTVELLGTPYCGKGEPNQVIRVGHASPACVFKDVEVFGGA